MGLRCAVTGSASQLSPGDGSADVVQLPAERSRPQPDEAPGRRLGPENLHFARFDLGVLCAALGVMPGPVYCTKIASRLGRTYTDKHGSDLAQLGVDLSKQQHLSDWAPPT